MKQFPKTVIWYLGASRQRKIQQDSKLGGNDYLKSCISFNIHTKIFIDRSTAKNETHGKLKTSKIEQKNWL